MDKESVLYLQILFKIPEQIDSDAFVRLSLLEWYLSEISYACLNIIATRLCCTQTKLAARAMYLKTWPCSSCVSTF